jgi:hypothetical protein
MEQLSSNLLMITLRTSYVHLMIILQSSYIHLMIVLNQVMITLCTSYNNLMIILQSHYNQRTQNMATRLQKANLTSSLTLDSSRAVYKKICESDQLFG